MDYSRLKTFAVHAVAYTLENGHAKFVEFGSQDFANDILSEGTIVSEKMKRVHKMRGADAQHTAVRLCGAGHGVCTTLSTVQKEQ